MEEVKRFSIWNGKQTHSDYYRNGHKTGSGVERYGFDGKYKHTDYYDNHGRKTGNGKRY